MRTTILTGVLAGLVGLSQSSCKKEADPINRHAATFPSTSAQQKKVRLHEEFASILQKIYQNTPAFREVQATIWSGYYADERVLLKDLLNPTSSPLYQSPAFKSFNTGSGHFRKSFEALIQSGDYPLLKQHLQSPFYTHQQPAPQLNSTGPSFDPDLGSNEEGALSIYFPYSDNFKPAFQDAEEDWLRATLVAADRDANEAPGLAPVNCNGNTCYMAVQVNDDYCEAHVVHIAQSGATVAPAPAPAVPSLPLNLVMLGNVRCTRQYDHLISFTNNGGGSEIRFIRADSYLEQNTNGQILSPQNVISVNFSRREIRKKNWKTINSIWDSNWETDNPEQVFAIYEEDNEGSRTLSGSIQAKLKIFTIEPIGYSITVKTKDDIIRQLGWKRNSFFTYNQGGLNNGCGTSSGFTIYDCNTPVSYTLPVRKQ